MIARVRGPVIDYGEDYVVIEAGGVGYLVRVPVPSILRLREALEAVLYTEFVVRQDAMLLYGFETKAEKEAFKLLISVSRIGPQLANAILGHLSVREIIEAVQTQNPAIFERVPGVGKTGAERINLELKKKIRVLLSSCSSMEITLSSGKSDAVLALKTLGYAEEESYAAVDEAIKEAGDQSASGLVRAALKILKEWR